MDELHTGILTEDARWKLGGLRPSEAIRRSACKCTLVCAHTYLKGWELDTKGQQSTASIQFSKGSMTLLHLAGNRGLDLMRMVTAGAIDLEAISIKEPRENYNIQPNH